MKKGKGRIIIGIIMIVLQLIGESNSGYTNDVAPAKSLGRALFDVASWIGFHAVGLIGAVLLIWGIIAYVRSINRTDNDDDCYEYYKSERKNDDIYKK